MIKTILFRPDQDNEEEFQFLQSFFVEKNKDVYLSTKRTDTCGNIVIGRYSVLPYYKELEADLQTLDHRVGLVNSFRQHSWIANFDYYDVLKNHTFETWRQHDLPYLEYDGPFVVKGCTNSKKHQWNTKMFAANKREAIEIGCELKNDMLIGNQDLLYRKYEPLETFQVGINGMRFGNEWRLFCYKNTILSQGYYWTGATEAENINKQGLELKGELFANSLLPLISPHVNFYVMDIAKKETGEWVLVELNDGQMSGLSMNDPDVLYTNLNKAINHELLL